MWYQASGCSVATVIHKKAVDQVLMKLILRSFYVQTTGTLKLFGFQSLPPVHVINKEVCFSSLFLTDSSINVCHTAREAKVAVDVRGESILYTQPTNSPHSVACQPRATDESLSTFPAKLHRLEQYPSHRRQHFREGGGGLFCPKC